MRLEAGATVEQSVTLTVTGGEPPKQADDTVQIRLEGGRLELPEIGVCLPSESPSLTDLEIARLRALRLSHLRIDLSGTTMQETLERDWKQAQHLELPLEIAVTLTDDFQRELETLQASLKRVRPAVHRVLLYHANPKRPLTALLETARSLLSAELKLIAGVNTDYIFTASSLPDAALQRSDGLAFAINPQVHAFDDSSLFETLEAQTAIVRDAGRRSGNVIVSPVTLKPRWNPYATASSQPIPPDPRQRALFAAVWTLGSLRALGSGGARSATYFEATGQGGLMDDEGVFPAYIALHDALEFGSRVAALETRSSDPSRGHALVVSRQGRTRALVMNFTAEPLTVRLEWPHARAWVRTLDERGAAASLSAPETDARAALEVRASGGYVEVRLLPLAYARIDHPEQSA